MADSLAHSDTEVDDDVPTDLPFLPQEPRLALDTGRVTVRKAGALGRSKSLPYGATPGVRRTEAAPVTPRSKFIRSAHLGLAQSTPKSPLPDLTVTFPGAASDDSVPLISSRAAPSLVRRLTTSSVSSRDLREKEKVKIRQSRMEEVEALGKKRRESLLAKSQDDESTGLEMKNEVPNLDSIPTNPRVWTPAHLSVYLTHVLKLVPAPLTADIRSYVLSTNLGGKQFLRMRESDLYELGINRRWVRVLAEARSGLRRECLRGRTFDLGEEEDEEFEVDANSIGLDVPKEAKWKHSWRKVSQKLRDGHVKGVAKIFEDDVTSHSPTAKFVESGHVLESPSTDVYNVESTSLTRQRTASMSSFDSSISLSDNESVLSTDEIDLEHIRYISEGGLTDDSMTFEVEENVNEEKSVAQLLAELESEDQAGSSDPASRYATCRLQHEGGDFKYSNVTKKASQELDIVELPKFNLCIKGQVENGKSSNPEVSTQTGGTLKVLKSQPASIRIVTPKQSDYLNQQTKDEEVMTSQTLEQLFETSGGDKLIGIVGTLSHRPSRPSTSRKPFDNLEGEGGENQRSGSIAIVKKSQLREMERRMKELERQLEGMGSLTTDEMKRDKDEVAVRSDSSGSLKDDWNRGVGWQDLGGYVVMASVGVGLVVGQVVLGKVFGIRR